jgi:hypothetical protein
MKALKCIICKQRLRSEAESTMLCPAHIASVRKKIRAQMKKTMRWHALARAAARAKAAIAREVNHAEV